MKCSEAAENQVVDLFGGIRSGDVCPSRKRGSKPVKGPNKRRNRDDHIPSGTGWCHMIIPGSYTRYGVGFAKPSSLYRATCGHHKSFGCSTESGLDRYNEGISVSGVRGAHA